MPQTKEKITTLEKMYNVMDAFMAANPGLRLARKQLFEEVQRKYPGTILSTLSTQYKSDMWEPSLRKIPRSRKPKPSIPTPRSVEVKKYFQIWRKAKELKHYRQQEDHLERLFMQECPQNVKLNSVLEKVCVLNTFYSTELNAPIHVAEHIVNNIKDFDARLKAGDAELVNEIAREGDILLGKQYEAPRNCFSFATKYCHHHYRSKFYVYDSNVENILLHFKDEFYDKDEFSGKTLSRNSMQEDYAFFHKVLEKFRCFYGIDKFDIDNWQLDKYLWLLGKEYYPKPTKKKNL